MNVFATSKAAHNFLAKEKKKGAENRRLWEEASHDAADILSICIGANPIRIFQWGSILHPERFREWSDIDFALEGLPSAETLFRLQEKCEKVTRFPVHLVEMERIEAEYADSIRENGRLVYER